MRLIRLFLLPGLTLLLLFACLRFQEQYRPVPQSPPAAIALSFDGERAYKHVEALAFGRPNRMVGSVGGASAGEYIAAQFQSLGLQVTHQDFTEFGFMGGVGSQSGWFKGRNIIAVSPGTGVGTVLFTAHRDAVPQAPQGALDNASGTAAMLELARILTAQPHLHTYVFAALDGEEVGMAGSRVLLNRRLPVLRDVRLAVNLDMIGFARTSALRVFSLDFVSPQVLGLLQQQVGERTDIRAKEVRVLTPPLDNATDGGLMRLRAIPVVDLADAPGPDGWGYHNAKDTVAQIDPTVLQDRGRLAEGLVRQGEALGGFVATGGLLLSQQGKFYVPPGLTTLAGTCLLLVAALPLVSCLLRRRFNGVGVRQIPRRALVAGVGAVGLAGMVTLGGALWRLPVLPWVVLVSVCSLIAVVTMGVALRRGRRPDHSFGQLLAAATPPVLFGGIWWLTARWPVGLYVTAPAYLLAVLINWRAGAGWRVLDVLWAIPLLVVAPAFTVASVLFAPLHLFPPYKLPLFAMLCAAATCVAVWAVLAVRPTPEPNP